MDKKYNITGMSCAACSAHIEKSVGKLDGVEQVSVNLLQNSMNVSYDENKVSSDEIIKAVKSGGYGAFEAGAAKTVKNKDKSSGFSVKNRLIISIISFLRVSYSLLSIS